MLERLEGVDWDGDAFTHGESERMAAAVQSLVLRADLDQSAFGQFLSRMAEPNQNLWDEGPRVDVQRLASLVNGKDLLRSLYVGLAARSQGPSAERDAAETSSGPWNECADGLATILGRGDTAAAFVRIWVLMTLPRLLQSSSTHTRIGRGASVTEAPSAQVGANTYSSSFERTVLPHPARAGLGSSGWQPGYPVLLAHGSTL
jgi:hypothetical protein